MRNRFGNRQVLCDGIGGFNPVGGAGGINPSNVNSVRVPGDAALDAIRNAGNVSLNGDTQKLLNIGQAMKDLGIIS
ncbi:MAG: hypothetical protein KGO93_09995 [Cyanobacteria bacterium REEB446]|nr:hypothetical protein [Cyanobacteria bacterium REEB446]